MKALLDLPEGHAQALLIILACIPAGLDWALTGSGGLRLQGVDVPVQDLDIQSNPAGVDEIARLLSGNIQAIPQWREGNQFRSHYGRLILAGIQVELMGDIQHHMPDGSWSPVASIPAIRLWLTWRGFQVPVLDLTYEAQAYEELGRTGKAALIHAAVTRGKLTPPLYNHNSIK